MSANLNTTKRINLTQLGAELGGAPLSLSDSGTERVITAHDTTTQARLQAAVDAHVPRAAPEPAATEVAIAAVVDAVLGHEEARDRSGAVFQPAQPGLAARLSSVDANGTTWTGRTSGFGSTSIRGAVGT